MTKFLADGLERVGERDARPRAFGSCGSILWELWR